MNDPHPQPIFDDRLPQPLPNSTLVLVLGIISIIGCCCYGGGLILGIIALVLANKDQRLYYSTPGMYTQASYDNLKAGKICAIISITISALYIILLVVFVTTVGIGALSDPAEMQKIFTR